MDGYLSERPACASRANIEPKPLIGVTPQQIANGSITGHFLYPIKLPNIIQRLDIRRQPSMGPKYLSLHNRSKRQVIKQLSEHLPHIVIFILAHALIIEPVILGNASGLMVAPEDGESFFVAHLDAEQQADCLEGIVAAVDVISQEEVVAVGDVSTDAEEFHQVVELTVDVAADVNRGSNIDHVGLLREDLSKWGEGYLALSQRALISCSLSNLHCDNLTMYSSKLPIYSRDNRFIFNLNLPIDSRLGDFIGENGQRSWSLHRFKIK